MAATALAHRELREERLAKELAVGNRVVFVGFDNLLFDEHFTVTEFGLHFCVIVSDLGTYRVRTDWLKPLPAGHRCVCPTCC